MGSFLTGFHCTHHIGKPLAGLWGHDSWVILRDLGPRAKQPGLFRRANDTRYFVIYFVEILEYVFIWRYIRQEMCLFREMFLKKICRFVEFPDEFNHSAERPKLSPPLPPLHRMGNLSIRSRQKRKFASSVTWTSKDRRPRK